MALTPTAKRTMILNRFESQSTALIGRDRLALKQWSALIDTWNNLTESDRNRLRCRDRHAFVAVPGLCGGVRVCVRVCVRCLTYDWTG